MFFALDRRRESAVSSPHTSQEFTIRSGSVVSAGVAEFGPDRDGRSHSLVTLGASMLLVSVPAHGKALVSSCRGLWKGKDASHNVEPDRNRRRRGLPPRAGPAGHDHRRDPRVRRADPAGGARRLALGQPDGGGGRALDDAGDPHAAGVQRVPDDPADDHADAAGLERRDDAAGADPGRRGRRSTRPAA